MDTNDLALAPDPPKAVRLGEACAACGERLHGTYCHSCGERRAHAEDESLWGFLREQFHEVTSADGKMWRTFRALFVPGELTAEYFGGRRTRYLRPIRLFLVLNVVLFFALGFLQRNPLMGELRTQQGLVGRAGMEAVDARVEAWGGDREMFVPLFDQRAGTLSSTMIVLLIPAFAVLFVLAFGRHSGARHLTYATHVVSALVGGYLALLAVLLVPVTILFAVGVGENILGPWLNWPLLILFLAATSWYLARGARRVYGVGSVRAWTGAVAVAAVGMPALIVGYRIALFWLTLWTLDLPPA